MSSDVHAGQIRAAAPRWRGAVRHIWRGTLPLRSDARRCPDGRLARPPPAAAALAYVFSNSELERMFSNSNVFYFFQLFTNFWKIIF